MKKKNVSKILFTNDEDLKEKMQTRGSRVKKQNGVKIKTFDFNYNFKEYLKLALAKILPRSDIGITFIPQKRIIIGQQTICTSLINKTIDEFQHKKFTVLSFKTDRDVDQIEYWLQEGAHIYRKGVIQVALRQLEKMKCFTNQCEQFRLKMEEKFFVLLRVDKIRQTKILQTINKVLLQSDERSTYTRQENTSISYEEGVSSLNSQSDLNVSAAPKQSNRSENESQQSFLISQSDETIVRDSFCIYSNEELSKFNQENFK